MRHTQTQVLIGSSGVELLLTASSKHQRGRVVKKANKRKGKWRERAVTLVLVFIDIFLVAVGCWKRSM